MCSSKFILCIIMGILLSELLLFKLNTDMTRTRNNDCQERATKYCVDADESLLRCIAGEKRGETIPVLRINLHDSATKQRESDDLAASTPAS